MTHTTCTASTIRPRLRHQAFSAGFSLIEVMVAMVIALLGILVMTQVFTLFEGQRRTTSGGDDAITAGGIALYGIQRDIQQSGWGIGSAQLIGCTVTDPLGAGAQLGPGPSGPPVLLLLVPVTINSPLVRPGDVNTDTLLIVSGSSNGTVEGDIIKAVTPPPAPFGYVMTSPAAFVPGDRVVSIPDQIQATPCLRTLNTVGASTSTTIFADNVQPVASTVQGPRLFNLGPAPKAIAYAIRNGKLAVCDYTANDCAAACTVADGPTGTTANGSCNASWLPIASDVVSLRAQYGRDTTEGNLADPTKIMDGIVDVWDRTVPAPATAGEANVNSCALLRVSAVRLVLVARSNQPEKAPGGVHVTTTAPVWAGSDAAAAAVNAANAAAVAIDLTLTRPDTTTWPTWQDFRYKVFETTVPMRNITSLGAVDGC